MSIDAGTIYSSIRIKLNDLNSDINTAVSKVDNFAKRINSVGSNVENINRLGKSITLGVTVPIVAASAAMVKFASDQTESLNAANVVFGKSAKIITDWGDKAATQAGLAKSEFYQSAAVIGAQFKNANFTLEESANQTINLTKRAADMASIFNTDVNDAMIALQASLRGEYEPARRFAISLSEATVSAEAVALGISKTGKELTNYQKTQARLSLIMKQTNQFQGDFVNTSDQLANSTRILQAEIKNQAAELGKELLPALLEIIKGARGLVENFSKLDDGTKKTVLAVAGFAAATGPLILGITNTIKAIDTLRVAMLALSANPIGLAIAGVSALYLGLKKLGDANQQKMLKEVGKQFGDIGELSGIAAENIIKVEEAMANASKGGAGFSETSDFVNQIAEDLGISADEVLAIGKNSTKVTQEYKDQLDAVTKMRNQLKDSKSFVIGTAEWIEKQKNLQGEVNAGRKEEIKEQKNLSDAEKAQIAGRIAAEEAYVNAVTITNLKVRDGLISQEQGLNDVASAQGTYLDALYQLGYASESEIGTRGSKAYKDMLESVKAYNEEMRQDDFQTQYKEQSDAVEELSDTTLSANEKARTQALAELDTLKAVTSEEVAQKQELIDKTNEYYDTLEDSEAIDKFTSNMGTALDSISELFSSLSSYYNAIYEQQIELLEKEMEAELEAAGLAEDTAVEKAQKEYEAAVEGGDAETIAASKQALEKAKIEEKYQKKKAELEYKQSVASWKLQVGMAVAQMAQAILNAYSSAAAIPVVGWTLAPVAAGIAAVASGIQLAAVTAAKPVKSYETGGIVPGGSGTLVNVAENGYDEVLFNTGPSGQTFAAFMASEIAKNIGNAGSQVIHITMEVDGEKMAENTMSYVRRGVVRA